MAKGIKTFLKVLYICAGIIVLVFIYLLSYNNYTLARIQKIAEDAIAAKDYNELERTFGSFFSTESILEDTSEDYDLVVYPSAVFSTYKYKVDDVEKTYEHSDRGYYIYYIKPKADDVKDVTIGTSMDNHAGIKYTFTDDKEYTYYFAVTDTYNKDVYVETPTTANESILKGSRNMFQIYSYLNYFDISLSESIVNAMKEEIGSTGTVKRITIVTSDGKDKDSYDVDLSFNQPFYDNIDEYVTKYNKYITDYTSTDDSSVKSDLTKDFEKYFYGENNDGFYYTFQNLANCGVAKGKEHVYPGYLIWQAIGMCALVLVVLFLLYMLIFHFKFLKNLVYRVGHREENLGRAGLSAKEKRNLVKADYSELQRRNQKASQAASAKVNSETKNEAIATEEKDVEKKDE